MRIAFLAALAGALLPAAAGAQPARDVSLRAVLRHQFHDDRSASGTAANGARGISYVAAFADLDGDGRPEAIVYLLGEAVCGTGGCTLEILTPAGRSWRRVAEMSVTNPPIRLLATRSHGWRDLGVHVGGGGGPAFEARLSFDGRHYPGNPSLAPALRARTGGRVLIPDVERGTPLF